MSPIRNCNTGSGLELTAAICAVTSHILTAAIADALSSNLLFLLKRQRAAVLMHIKSAIK
jgi:hypothetical protein